MDLLSMTCWRNCGASNKGINDETSKIPAAVLPQGFLMCMLCMNACAENPCCLFHGDFLFHGPAVLVRRLNDEQSFAGADVISVLGDAVS